MVWNLIELIKASGGAGSSGQTFRNNVKPFNSPSMNGFKMSDYKITGVSFSGEPLYWNDIPAGNYGNPYPDNTLFNVTATFTRGNQAYRIQRNISGAWNIYLLPIYGSGANSSVTVETFTSNNDGESHSLGLRVRGARSGTPSVGIAKTPQGGEPAFYGDPWLIVFQAVVTNNAVGASEFYLNATYDPDTGNFNPSLDNLDPYDNGWPFRVANRGWDIGEFQFRWWEDYNNANANTSPEGTGTEFMATSFGAPGVTVYMRYSTDGGSSWSSIQSSTQTDNRQQA